MLLPSEVLAVDFSGSPESSAVDQQLVAFLGIVGKAPWSLTAMLRNPFFNWMFDEHLGLDFTPCGSIWPGCCPSSFCERVDSTLTPGILVYPFRHRSAAATSRWPMPWAGSGFCKCCCRRPLSGEPIRRGVWRIAAMRGGFSARR